MVGKSQKVKSVQTLKKKTHTHTGLGVVVEGKEW